MRQRTQKTIDGIRTWLDETLVDAAPGERLPTMREFMRKFSTAQRTVEVALQPYLAAGQLVSRPGAGIAVAGLPRKETEEWEGDLLALYRVSESRLARVMLQETQSRLRARGHTILQIGYSSNEQALSVLERIGRFRTALLQVNFEVLSIDFLAALHRHVGSIVIDGISATGIDLDAVGTNWREALAVAFRMLREKGHDRIAFLTSAHQARQIAMARREFHLLTETLPHPQSGWLIEIDLLPGSYQASDISEALSAHLNADGRLPFTALIAWGVVEGAALERSLNDIGQHIGRDLSVVLLGSTDFPSEHLGRIDVVGNSNAEKLETFEDVLTRRIGLEVFEPRTHYLTIGYVDHGSIVDLRTK